MRDIVDKETMTEKPNSPAIEALKVQGQPPRVNGKTSAVRTASKEQFDKAHRKTSAAHAGLFRRLAK